MTGIQLGPSQPVVIIAGPKPQPRLEAGGWFSRSFASASGVMLGIVAVLLGVVAIGALVVCGGLAALSDVATPSLHQIPAAAETPEAPKAPSTAAVVKGKAKSALLSRGIRDMDPRATVETRGSRWIVEGKAVKRNGKVCDFTVEFSRAHDLWNVEGVSIDGEDVP